MIFYRRHIARILNVHPRTIWRWNLKGTLVMRKNPVNNRAYMTEEEAEDLSKNFYTKGYWDYREFSTLNS